MMPRLFMIQMGYMSYGFETMNSFNSFNEIPKLYQNRAFWKFAAFIGCKSDLAANVLDDETITYDTNATACHMPRHCFLARVLSMLVLQSGSASATGGEKVDRLQMIGSCKRNFGAEEQLFAGGKYIGSNAIDLVIGTLSSNSHALDLRWRLYF
jgi:hypothetical protein